MAGEYHPIFSKWAKAKGHDEPTPALIDEFHNTPLGKKLPGGAFTTPGHRKAWEEKRNAANNPLAGTEPPEMEVRARTSFTIPEDDDDDRDDDGDAEEPDEPEERAPSGVRSRLSVPEDDSEEPTFQSAPKRDLPDDLGDEPVEDDDYNAVTDEGVRVRDTQQPAAGSRAARRLALQQRDIEAKNQAPDMSDEDRKAALNVATGMAKRYSFYDPRGYEPGETLHGRSKKNKTPVYGTPHRRPLDPQSFSDTELREKDKRESRAGRTVRTNPDTGVGEAIEIGKDHQYERSVEKLLHLYTWHAAEIRPQDNDDGWHPTAFRQYVNEVYKRDPGFFGKAANRKPVPQEKLSNFAERRFMQHDKDLSNPHPSIASRVPRRQTFQYRDGEARARAYLYKSPELGLTGPVESAPWRTFHEEGVGDKEMETRRAIHATKAVLRQKGFGDRARYYGDNVNVPGAQFDPTFGNRERGKPGRERRKDVSRVVRHLITSTGTLPLGKEHLILEAHNATRKHREGIDDAVAHGVAGGAIKPHQIEESTPVATDGRLLDVGAFHDAVSRHNAAMMREYAAGNKDARKLVISRNERTYAHQSFLRAMDAGGINARVRKHPETRKQINNVPTQWDMLPEQHMLGAYWHPQVGEMPHALIMAAPGATPMQDARATTERLDPDQYDSNGRLAIPRTAGKEPWHKHKMSAVFDLSPKSAKDEIPTNLTEMLATGEHTKLQGPARAYVNGYIGAALSEGNRRLDGAGDRYQQIGAGMETKDERRQNAPKSVAAPGVRETFLRKHALARAVEAADREHFQPRGHKLLHGPKEEALSVPGRDVTEYNSSSGNINSHLEQQHLIAAEVYHHPDPGMGGVIRLATPTDLYSEHGQRWLREVVHDPFEGRGGNEGQGLGDYKVVLGNHATGMTASQFLDKKYGGTRTHYLVWGAHAGGTTPKTTKRNQAELASEHEAGATNAEPELIKRLDQRIQATRVQRGAKDAARAGKPEQTQPHDWFVPMFTHPLQAYNGHVEGGVPETFSAYRLNEKQFKELVPYGSHTVETKANGAPVWEAQKIDKYNRKGEVEGQETVTLPKYKKIENPSDEQMLHQQRPVKQALGITPKNPDWISTTHTEHEALHGGAAVPTEGLLKQDLGDFGDGIRNAQFEMRTKLDAARDQRLSYMQTEARVRKSGIIGRLFDFFEKSGGTYPFAPLNPHRTSPEKRPGPLTRHEDALYPEVKAGVAAQLDLVSDGITVPKLSLPIRAKRVPRRLPLPPEPDDITDVFHTPIKIKKSRGVAARLEKVA